MTRERTAVLQYDMMRQRGRSEEDENKRKEKRVQASEFVEESSNA